MNFKKILLGISLVSLVMVALVSYAAVAHADNDNRHGDDRHEARHEDNHNNGKNFNPDKQLSKAKCGSNLGNPVINVTQKVQNDVDSGFAGNNWAFDYYTRHITVWQVAPAPISGTASYCAIVTYDGNFYAVPGEIGPGNNPVGALISTAMDEPVNGKMSGGYRATFNGTLTPSSWPTNGSVGTTNYQCNLGGTCPGHVDWVAQYFPGYTSFDQPWWGWQYKGGSHGTWTNAIDVLQPVSGNIL